MVERKFGHSPCKEVRHLAVRCTCILPVPIGLNGLYRRAGTFDCDRGNGRARWPANL